MSGFVFHPAAIADLDEIWEYIAADSLTAADRVLEEIRETIESLVSFPEMGHARNDLTYRPIRFHPVRDFLIAYARDEKGCSCLRSFTAAEILASLLRCCGEEPEEFRAPSAQRGFCSF